MQLLISKLKSQEIDKILKKVTKSKELNLVKQASSLLILTYDDVSFYDETSLKKLKTTLAKQFSVKEKQITLIPPKPSRNLKANTTSTTHDNKSYYFFLDIDKTITDGGTKFLDTRVPDIFTKMGVHHYLILASGRAVGDIYNDIQESGAQKQAIAENGGVITESKPSGDTILGKKHIVESAIKHLQKNGFPDLVPITKVLRKSEVTVNLKPYKVEDIQSVIDADGLNIQLNPSPTSIHISQKGIDKGHAVREFLKMFGISKADAVGIGDSLLDVSLFNATAKSFAVGNSAKKIQKKATKTTAKEYFDGVIEAFQTLDNRFSP